MDAVAIGADGGLLRAVGDGAAVHAGLIGEEGLRGFAIRLHKEFLPVAAAAGDGNIAAIDGGFGVVAGDDGVDVAVAILAACGDFAGTGDLCVNTMRVTLAFIGMALVAGDFFRRRVVGEAFDVGVAIDAGKSAVNGVLELALVDGDAVAVAIGHAGVAVAGEAVGVPELLRGDWGGGPGKTEKSERKKSKPANKVHALRRRFGGKTCRDRSHRDSYSLLAVSFQVMDEG